MRKISTLVRGVSDLPRAIKWIMEMAPRVLGGGDLEISMGKTSKSLAAERKYHCLLKDISQLSSKYKDKHSKALMVKWFSDEMEEAGTPLSTPGESMTDPKTGELFFIRPSTTDFRVGEASQFIEFLYAYGSRNGVQWSKHSTDIFNEYKDAQR